MNVYQKLNNAREEFHNLELKKTGHNKFAGYNYFELGDFLIPALAIFKKHGLCGTISFGCGSNIAKLCVVNVEKPDEYIPFESPMGSAALKGCHEVQNIGAVETYQRRYLWVAALEIVEHDALDSSEPVKEAKARPSVSLTDTLEASVSMPRKRTGVMADVLSDMPPLSSEDTMYYKELAGDIEELLTTQGARVAYDRIKAENLDNDCTLYLWQYLNSKVRSVLKAEKAARQPQPQKETV